MVLPLLLATLALPTAQEVGGLWHEVRHILGNPAEFGLGAFAGGGDADGDQSGDLAIIRASPPRVQVFSGVSGLLIWEMMIPGRYPYVTPYSICWVRDVDGDRSDELALADVNSNTIYVHAGSNGSVLWSYSNSSLGQLGRCMDSEGDLSGDGVSDLIVYAPWAPHPIGFGKGACLVFSGTDGAIVRTIYEPIHWTSSTSGRRVASAGDLDGDGLDELLIGYVDTSGLDETRLYSGASGAVIRSYSEYSDYFGASVANAGDLDGDSIPDHLVSAPGSSKVFAYSGASGARLWIAESPPHVGNPWFGTGLSAVADLDADRVPDVLVGAPQYRQFIGEPYGGAVFLVSGADGAVLARERGQYGTRIGDLVSVMGDADGDGTPEVVYGGPPENYGGPNLGSVTIAEWFAGLGVSTTSLSVAPGGVIKFFLRWPDTEAGRGYEVLVSGSGVGPTDWHGVAVPLNFDAWTRRLHRGFTPLMPDAKGRLDADGAAVVRLDWPAGAGSQWIGRTIWFSAVTERGAQPYAASLVRAVEVLP